jgi:sporulation protein YlmC with PRC-barrel domain
MSETQTSGTSANPTISAHRVEGTPVFNTRGDRIGRIEDLMIEKVSGNVTSAIMSFGKVLGLGGDHYPLPWSILTFDTDRKGYVIDEDKLREAPSVGSDERQESDLPWRDDVYRYWAAMPYWMP